MAAVYSIVQFTCTDWCMVVFNKYNHLVYGDDGMLIEVFLRFSYVMTGKPNNASSGRSTHTIHPSILLLIHVGQGRIASRH